MLDQNTDPATCWLLIFQLIDNNGLETVCTNLEEFTDATPVGEGKCGESTGIQYASVQRLRLEEYFSWSHSRSQPEAVTLIWRQQTRPIHRKFPVCCGLF